ncbi:PfkB family carbohydrate kinase [Micromonospora sp. NPDC051196]|uniref:carbohydrate kinase family protein n=1 Tax=Micromonospora sp. NPDC051196 TaxID=3155281 RepID=UPI003447F4E0
MRTARILVVGGLNVDVHLLTDDEPGDDGTAIVTQLRTSAGGHAGNGAAALARLGADTAILSAVGDDPDGERLVSELRRSGVDTGTVLRLAGAPTGRVVIPHFRQRRYMLMHRGALDLMPEDAGSKVELAAVDAVLMFDPVPPVARSILVRAGWAGVPVYWNPGGAMVQQEGFAKIARAASVIFVNRAEFAHLCADHRIEALLLGASRLRRLVVTMGRDGAVEYRPEAVLTATALAVTEVDATGAGDAFAAAYAFADIANLGPSPLAIACVAGSLAAAAADARGADTRLPDLLARVAEIQVRQRRAA